MTCSSYAKKMIIFSITAIAMIVPKVDGLQSAAVMANYSKDAISLFNNMRTPAALLTGGLIPLGVLMNSPIKEDDTTTTRVVKKAGAILGVASLLSEITAVFYSSIAINKLVELPSPPTASVADLLSKQHNLMWLGTNIHFLTGMMGFGLLIGLRIYLISGGAMGKLAATFSAAFFLQSLAVVNSAIAMGRSGVDYVDATNFGQLFLLYCLSMFRFATRGRIGICSVLAIGTMVAGIAGTMVTFYKEFRDGASKKNSKNNKISST